MKIAPILVFATITLIAALGCSTGPTPTPKEKDVFGASVGKLPAGVAAKSLNEQASQCKWALAGKTAGQRIISLHATPKGTVIGGLYGRSGVYRVGAGTSWEYVPFIAGHEAEALVLDLASTPAGRIYAAVWNPANQSEVAIPDQAMALPTLPGTPTPTPATTLTKTPNLPYQGLLVSDEDGAAGSWANPQIWQEALWGVAPTENGAVYFAGPKGGLHYAAGDVLASTVAESVQLFPDLPFRNLLLTDSYLFAVGFDNQGIFRMELESNGGPTTLFGAAKKPPPSMMLLAGTEVWDIIDDTYGKQLFAATEGSGVFRSQNSGDTWASKSIGLPEGLGSKFKNKEVPHIPAVIATHTGLLFASVAGVGVFVSGNNAEYWSPLGEFGLSEPVVEALEFVKGGVLIAGTTNGIYTYPKHCMSALAKPVKSPRRELRR